VRSLVFISSLYIFLCIAILGFALPDDGYIDYLVYNQCLTNGSYPDIEPGFAVICQFTSLFSESTAITLARMLSLTLLLTSFLYFYKAFGVYTAFFHIFINGFQTLGAYRQGTATILMCVAVVMLMKSHKIRAFGTIIFATLFHYSYIFFIFVVVVMKFANRYLAILVACTVIFSSFILLHPLTAYIIPQTVLYRYDNLLNESLPVSSYFALGKVWYVVYYTYFNIILWRSFEKINNIILLNFSYVLFALTLCVPILTLMDSWAATRISSMTNPLELIFFAVWASSMQRLIMLGAYMVRTGVAFINFFVV